MRQLRTGLVAGFKNRSGGRHRMQERCASGVGGCSDHDGHMAQTRGQDRIRVAIAAREPVWLAEQKVDADYSRLCCDFREPGELVAPPGPLSNVADRVALDLDDQGSVRRPRSRQVAFVSVKYQLRSRPLGVASATSRMVRPSSTATTLARVPPCRNAWTRSEGEDVCAPRLVSRAAPGSLN